MNFFLKKKLIILFLLSNIVFSETISNKALNGHPNSQYELALKSISSDANKAEDLLLIAALQSHYKSINYLRNIFKDRVPIINELISINQNKKGLILTYLPSEKIDKTELNILREKGNNGDIDSQYLIWLLYVNDKGVKKSEAYTWLKQAAGNNHPKALFGLGLLYYYGYIVPEERDRAKKLIKKSSKLDFNLASIFLKSSFK